MEEKEGWVRRVFDLPKSYRPDRLLIYGLQVAALAPPLLAIALYKKFGIESALTAAEIGLAFAVLVIWVFGFHGALFVLLKLRRVERRNRALGGFVASLRDYSVSNIEPLRASFDELKIRNTEEPPGAFSDSASEGSAEEGLRTKERNSYLAIIGVLCKDAGIDYSRAAAAAAVIANMAQTQGVRIGETTIENKLKLVPDVMAAKSK